MFNYFLLFFFYFCNSTAKKEGSWKLKNGGCNKKLQISDNAVLHCNHYALKRVFDES